MKQSGTGVRRGLLQSLGLLVASTVLLGGWLLAAPPGASPDDGYHLASIWCAEGYTAELCLEDPSAPEGSPRVLIPFSTNQLLCFQHDGRQSAACALEAQRTDTVVFSVVNSSNIGRQRPNAYYWFMHQLISDDFSASLTRMRTANLLLVVSMFSLTAALATATVRRAFLLSSLLASVPLGLFLVTSLNTAAWGLTGLVTLWANGMTAMGHEKSKHRRVAFLLMCISAALALGSRSEAVVHIGVTLTVLALIAPSLRAGRTDFPEGRSSQFLGGRWAQVLVLSLATATSLFALVQFAPRSARLASVGSNLQEGYRLLEARGLGNPIVAIAFEVPSLWTGAIGHIWGLGALDTPIPTLATLPIAGSVVALLTLGLHRSARPRFLAALTVAGALFFFPLFALLQAGVLVYEQLQPRQFMALLFLILGVSLVTLPQERPLVLSTGLRGFLLAGLSLAHSVALLVTMRRHISGLVEFRYVNLASEIEWWWPTGPAPNVIWLTASVAFAVGMAIVLQLFATEPAKN